MKYLTHQLLNSEELEILRKNINMIKNIGIIGGTGNMGLVLKMLLIV